MNQEIIFGDVCVGVGGFLIFLFPGFFVRMDFLHLLFRKTPSSTYMAILKWGGFGCMVLAVLQAINEVFAHAFWSPDVRGNHLTHYPSFEQFARISSLMAIALSLVSPSVSNRIR